MAKKKKNLLPVPFDATDPATWPNSMFDVGVKALAMHIDMQGGLITDRKFENRIHHLRTSSRDIFLAMLDEAIRLNAEN